jgi:transposase InsO family protein
LDNHAAALVSMDFFTVPTLTGRILFVLVLLAHQRRRVVHLAITDHPTAAWTAQQVIEAFPEETAPRYLVRDRDAIYSDVFRRRVAGMDIREVVSAPSSPWQNPYAERLIGSLRRECLDHIIILSQTHLRRVLTRYAAYYHRARTHPLTFRAPMAHEQAHSPRVTPPYRFLVTSPAPRSRRYEGDAGSFLAKDRLARVLSGHTVHAAQSRGWDTLSNGALLNAAAR